MVAGMLSHSVVSNTATPWTPGSPPGSSVDRIFQARILVANVTKCIASGEVKFVFQGRRRKLYRKIGSGCSFGPLASPVQSVSALCISQTSSGVGMPAPMQR